MNPDNKKEYKVKAIYAIVVLVVSAVIILGVITKMDFSKYAGILSPFLYGLVIAYILNYVVNFFKRIFTRLLVRGSKTKEKMRLIKAISIVMAYIVFGFVLYLFSKVIFPQLYASMKDLIGNYRIYINSAYEWVRAFVYRHEILVGILYSGFFEGMLSDLANNLMSFLGEYSPKALAFIERFANEVKNLFFGIFISIYMLIGKETFKAQTKKLMSAFASDTTYKKVISFFHECDYRFGGFIVGKLIDSTIIGIITYTCCLLFGFPYAALISFIIGVTNIIPIAGPIIGAIPSAFLILLAQPDKVIWFILFVFILQQIDGNLIGPLVLGDKTGLSAFWVLTSLIIMGGLYGVFGMILAVPLCSVIYYEIKIIAEKRLAAKKMPTETSAYAGDDDRFLIPDEKKQTFSSRIKAHKSEMEEVKKTKD